MESMFRLIKLLFIVNAIYIMIELISIPFRYNRNRHRTTLRDYINLIKMFTGGDFNLSDVQAILRRLLEDEDSANANYDRLLTL